MLDTLTRVLADIKKNGTTRSDNYSGLIPLILKELEQLPDGWKYVNSVNNRSR